MFVLGMLGFSIGDLTLHGQWHICQVRRKAQCNVSLTCLGSHPSLANCTGASVEVVKARCHTSSCNLRLSFGPFETRSLQQKAAAQESQLWDCYQRKWSESKWS